MYTVLVGLIPAIARLLMWLISPNQGIDMLNAVDFIIFGLVLHISNINELEHFNARGKSWKTIYNGVSVFFIAVYSILFAYHIFGESNPGSINNENLKYIAVVLGIASLVISLSVYNETSKLDEES